MESLSMRQGKSAPAGLLLAYMTCFCPREESIKMPGVVPGMKMQYGGAYQASPGRHSPVMISSSVWRRRMMCH